MWDNTSILCFESEAHANIAASLHPDLDNQGRILSYTAFVSAFYQEATPGLRDRSEEFSQLLLPNQREQQPIFEQTVSTLRQALLLTHTDVDFCLSLMPDTPRIRELMRLLHLYLDSDLTFDWTHTVWNLIEKLKELSIVNPFPPKILFAPDEPGTQLFAELARAYAYAQGVEQVHSLESADLASLFAATDRPQPTTALSPTLYWASAIQGISHLAQQIRSLLDNGEEAENLLVPFFGQRQHVDLFRYQLDHFAIEYSNWLEDSSPIPSKSPDSLGKWIDKIRKHRGRPLRDRLNLCNLLLEDPLGRRLKTDWPTYFQTLKEKQKLSEADSNFLTTLMEETSSTPAAHMKENKTGVRILPFRCPLIRPNDQVLAFADHSIGQPPLSNLLLEADEVNTLFRQGFLVPRWEEQKLARQKQLQLFLFSFPAPLSLFTSIEPKQLPVGDIPVHVLEASPTPATAPTTEERDVSLPIKPLSASQLEAYARCPSKYFFSNRLRLEPSKRQWENRYPLLFGIATHHTFEKLLKEGKTLTSPDALCKAFSETVFTLEPTLDQSHPVFVILTQHFNRVAWLVPQLEDELKRLYGTVSTLALEKSFEIEVEGLRARGMIDRIDRTEDGHLLLLDYKTGSVSFSPNKILNGKHFQALLYLLAAEKEHPGSIVGLLFYDIKKGQLRRGIIKEHCVSDEAKRSVTRGHALSAEKYASLIANGQAQLSLTASAIREGRFEPTPSSSICTNCHAAALCRKGAGYA